MVSITSLILLPLAVAWVTWLVVDAAITLPIRQRVLKRSGEDGKLTYLVHCTNCTALWVSLLACIPTCLALTFPLWMTPLVVLAMAQLAPMVLTVADRLAMAGD
jgi:hypothetical protein